MQGYNPGSELVRKRWNLCRVGQYLFNLNICNAGNW